MAGRPILTGLKFGRLYVVGFHAKGMGARMWSCNCDCGTMCVIVSTTKLLNGLKQSCGCLHREATAAIRRTHGRSKTTEHNIWMNMRRRCNYPGDAAFPNYGGRGISVCLRWSEFENFYADMGPRPSGSSLDRINNDGNYEPGNCRWATAKEQGRNKRTNRLLTVDGVTASLVEHCESRGLKYETVLMRLKAGHPPEVALARECWKGTTTYRAKRRALEQEKSE